MSSACVHLQEGKKKRQFSNYEALLSHVIFPSDEERAHKKVDSARG